MPKKSKAILRRAVDHCTWKYGKSRKLVSACKSGAAAAVDEARHEAPGLGGRRGKKRLVDCSVECSRSGRHDFNVWPRKGESDKEACLRRAKAFQAAVDDCGVLRARGIDGIGKSGTPASIIRFKDRMGGKPGKIVRET